MGKCLGKSPGVSLRCAVLGGGQGPWAAATGAVEAQAQNVLRGNKNSGETSSVKLQGCQPRFGTLGERPRGHRPQRWLSSMCVLAYGGQSSDGLTRCGGSLGMSNTSDVKQMDFESPSGLGTGEEACRGKAWMLKTGLEQQWEGGGPGSRLTFCAKTPGQFRCLKVLSDLTSNGTSPGVRTQ